MMYPHDPDGAAGETINCRCTMINDKQYQLQSQDNSGTIDDIADNEKAANDFMINRENSEITKYNPKADYTIKVPGLSDEVNKGLSEATRNVAEKGTKN